MAQLRLALLEGSLGQLEQCVPALTEAARHLRSLESRARQADGSAASAEAEELRRLKPQLAAVMRLIENGAEFYHGWARLLCAAAGYTATGEAAPLAASFSEAPAGPGRISLAG